LQRSEKLNRGLIEACIAVRRLYEVSKPLSSTAFIRGLIEPDSLHRAFTRGLTEAESLRRAVAKEICIYSYTYRKIYIYI
jgi:hypothetical protein